MSRRKGSSSPFSNPDTKAKAVQTNIDKYGVDNPFKSPEIQEKIRQKNIGKYGVDNPSKSPEVIERIKQSQRKTFDRKKQEKYDALQFVVPDWDAIRGTRTMSEAGIKLHYPKFYNYILENYPLDIPFKERLWMYIHNTTERPVCKVCGKPVSFKNMEYATYCSSKCCNSDPEKITKTKDVLMEKYGVGNPSNIPGITEKKKTTCERHFNGGYGSKEIQEKVKKTNMERYGVEYYRNPEKSKQTKIERYGVEYYRNPEKSKQTMMERYGVEYGIQLPSARLSTNNSQPNRAFEKILKQNNIEYIREFPMGSFVYDFKIGNTLVEINPSATHNVNFNPFDNKPMKKGYHAEKTNAANRNGFHCIHVWDWDEPEKIVKMLLNKKTIGARKCIIKEVDKGTAIEFLNNNHLQGPVRGISISIGLYYKDELVGIMCWGAPRYIKRFSFELLRMCFKSDVIVNGGAERMFNYFIEKYKPESIVSYCDASKFDGSIYNKLDFKLESNAISKHWFNLKTHQHITDNMLRARGYDQIFKTNYGKGTSNEQLMRDNGFVEIFDCGQKRYAWYQLHC